MLTGSDFILMRVITTVLTILILVKSMLVPVALLVPSLSVTTLLGDIDPGVFFFLAILIYLAIAIEN